MAKAKQAKSVKFFGKRYAMDKVECNPEEHNPCPVTLISHSAGTWFAETDGPAYNICDTADGDGPTPQAAVTALEDAIMAEFRAIADLAGYTVEG